MLQELLLAISGLASPLVHVDNHGKRAIPAPALSSSEFALVNQIARIGSLESEARSRATEIASHHPSTICRAIASAVLTDLDKFQEDVVSVEHSILGHDSLLVGAYNVVPISGLLIPLDRWSRILPWVRQFLLFIQVSDGKLAGDLDGRRSGAQAIDRLRRESQTGYHEIESTVLRLLSVGESSWLRQVSTWILYGRLPLFNDEDFFIQQISSASVVGEMFQVSQRLAPSFLEHASAKSVLYIGKSLRHIEGHMNTAPRQLDNVKAPDTARMLSKHLGILSSLKRPIDSADLSRVVSAMRSSLAQEALQLLLPTRHVVQTLSMLHEFLSGGRSEFINALIHAADACLDSRHIDHSSNASHSDSHRLKGIMIKEAELSGVLIQALNALQPVSQDSEVDEQVEMARHSLQLIILKPSSKASLVHTNLHATTSLFQDMLFGTPAMLELKLQPPMDLILTVEDVETYSALSSYLLSIHRARLHLAELWKLTGLRRRDTSRICSSGTVHQTGSLRHIWATVSLAHYFLVELGLFTHGELDTAWYAFKTWIGIKEDISAQQETTCRVHSSGSNRGGEARLELRDPQTISAAHKQYLASMHERCLLSNQNLTGSLRTLLVSIDQLVALIKQLDRIQQIVDIPWSRGEAANEVEGNLHALLKSDKQIRDLLNRIMGHLRELDSQHHGGVSVPDGKPGESESDFRPPKSAGIGHLLLKLDSIQADSLNVSFAYRVDAA